MKNLKEYLVFVFFHKWKYLIAIARSKFYKKPASKKVKNIVYVAREKDRDWIFGAKVRRLSKYSSLSSKVYFHDKLRHLPDADGFFYVYQNYFCRCIRSTPNILNKKNIVMFTHPNWTTKYSKTHVVWCLNKANYIICLNSSIKDYLIELGVKPQLLKIIHIGTSSSFFYQHERNTGKVGFCSNFGERKNSDLVYNIIKNMPNQSFCIIGRNWENYSRFAELDAMPNFTYYKDRLYEEYPSLYNEIDVFVSPSTLEGGPVPVLEAMMSNCVPVASRTGFCPDLISHGENGFLFDTDSNYPEVIELIEKAFLLKANVRDTVMDYTWEKCSKTIDNLFLN
jgi:glycosyltransferase involved in cell wall biosynthesis